MRCINCGWNNSEMETDCIKCKHPLGQAGQLPAHNEQRSFPGTIPGKQSSDLSSGQIPGPNDLAKEKETVRTAVPLADHAETLNCPACNYLMNRRSRHCPNCGHSMTDAAPATVVSRENTKETVLDRLPGTTPAMTIDPYRQKPTDRKEVFLLRLDAKEEPPVMLSFKSTGDSIELSRDNLDELNNTITAKIQAQLVFSGDKWRIKDLSEQKTSFIQLSDQHELKEGDILLMGNKKFMFYTKNPNL